MAKDKMNIQFRIKAVDAFTKTMAKLDRQLDHVKDKAEKLGTIENITVNVTGDKKAKHELEKVSDKIDEVNRKSKIRIFLDMSKMSWGDFRRRMDLIADLSRDFGQVLQSEVFSTILAFSSPAIGAIYSLTGALGAMGPVLGTAAGGVMGLGSAFLSAGAGAAAFGALAVTALGDVFEANSNIRDLRKELANTTDLEERRKITEQIAEAYKSLSKEQRKALGSLEALSKTWGEITDKMEPKIVTAFATAMVAVEGVLKRLEPMFESVADSAVKLANSFKINTDSGDFKSFVDFLNRTAAPMFESISRAAGNFAMGFANLFAAFGPLAESTAAGFEEMSKRFREWTAGLSESERFNSFIDYVMRNGPKLLSIFGGLTLGLVDMFAAFGPLAEDMLDGLLDMIRGFQEWASTLDENQGFQDFIEYVRTHGPELLELFGELRDFVLNLADGFAEFSKKITPVLTSFFEWTNRIMEANPWIAELIAFLLTMLGIVGFMYAPLALIASLFGRLALTWLMSAGNATTFMGALKTLWGIIVRTGTFLLRFVSIWALVAMWVAFVAKKIYEHWGEITTFVNATWTGLKLFFGMILDQIANIFDNFLNYIDVQTGGKFKAITDIIRSAVDTISDVISIFLDHVGDMWALAMDFWKALMELNFGEMWSIIKKAMGRMKDTIVEIWNRVMEFFRGIDLYQVGRDIIQGLINGVGSMASALVKKASGVVGGAIDKAKNLLGINSPSKVFFQFGEWTGEGFMNGLDRMMNGVSKSAEAMVGAAIPKQRSSTSYVEHPRNVAYKINSGNSSKEDRGQVRESVNVTLPIIVNGREIAKATREDITNRQERSRKLERIFEEGSFA